MRPGPIHRINSLRPGPNFLTVTEFAEKHRLDIARVRQAINTKRIEAVKLERWLFIRDQKLSEEVEDYCKRWKDRQVKSELDKKPAVSRCMDRIRPDGFLNINEYCKKHRLDTSAFYRLVHLGRIPFTRKIGRYVFIRDILPSIEILRICKRAS